jgi:hypothetical protein
MIQSCKKSRPLSNSSTENVTTLALKLQLGLVSNKFKIYRYYKRMELYFFLKDGTVHQTYSVCPRQKLCISWAPFSGFLGNKVTYEINCTTLGEIFQNSAP